MRRQCEECGELEGERRRFLEGFDVCAWRTGCERRKERRARELEAVVAALERLNGPPRRW